MARRIVSSCLEFPPNKYDCTQKRATAESTKSEIISDLDWASHHLLQTFDCTKLINVLSICKSSQMHFKNYRSIEPYENENGEKFVLNIRFYNMETIKLSVSVYNYKNKLSTTRIFSKINLLNDSTLNLLSSCLEKIEDAYNTK